MNKTAHILPPNVAVPTIPARPLVRPFFYYRDSEADFVDVNRVTLNDWYAATGAKAEFTFAEFCSEQWYQEHELFAAAGGFRE